MIITFQLLTQRTTWYDPRIPIHAQTNKQAANGAHESALSQVNKCSEEWLAVSQLTVVSDTHTRRRTK